MDFNSAHKIWLDSHLEKRKGERKGRLERGHQHAEVLFMRNVWWTMNGNFDNLHPEYEILDLRRRPYFGDFAFLPGHIKFIWEIKGFDTHVRDMDRNGYCDELNRETFFHGLGFRVVSFAYDDVAYRPELCITLLRILLGQFKPAISPANLINRNEKEIILLAFQLARPIRPIDVENHLTISHRYSVTCLQSLCNKGWLHPIPCGKGHKVLLYELTKKNLDEMNW